MNTPADRWQETFDKILYKAMTNGFPVSPGIWVLTSLKKKGNWRAAARLKFETQVKLDKLLNKALNSKYRTPFLDEIKNEFFILRLKGEI